MTELHVFCSDDGRWDLEYRITRLEEADAAAATASIAAFMRTLRWTLKPGPAPDAGSRAAPSNRANPAAKSRQSFASLPTPFERSGGERAMQAGLTRHRPVPEWLLEPLVRFPTSLGAATAAALVAALRWSPDVAWLLGLAAIFAWATALRLALEARVATPWPVRLLLPWAAVLLLPLPHWAGPPAAAAWLVPLSGALAIVAAPLADRRSFPPEATATWGRAVLWAATQALAVTLLLATGLSLLLSGAEALFAVGLSPAWPRWIWSPGLLLVLPWLTLALLPRLDLATPSFGVARWPLVLLDRLLAPLVLAFAALLNAYCLFILVRGEMPKGVVAPMVVAFALVSGALWCLTFGRRREGIASRLVRRWLLPALAAPAAALLLATWQRIDQYGLTEPRYLLLMLGALLLGAAAYQVLARRTPGPAAVALLAAVLALAASAGPWGATALSVRSQLDRLERQLAAAGHLKAGAADPLGPPVPAHDAWEIGRTIHYLVDRGQRQAIVRRLHLPAPAGGSETSSGAAQTQSLALAMGVHFDAPRGELRFQLHQPLGTPLRVAGFDTLVSRNLRAGWPDVLELPGGTLRLELSASGRAIYISRAGALLWRFDLGPLLARETPDDPTDLVLDAVAPDGTRLRLRIERAEGEHLPSGDPALQEASVDLLLTDRPNGAAAR